MLSTALRLHKRGTSSNVHQVATKLQENQTGWPRGHTIEARGRLPVLLEMWERKLIQTAVKRLLRHGESLMGPEKPENGSNTFPQLIQIKHLFPQLRGEWWEREVLNGRTGQKMTLVKIAPKEGKHEHILKFYCPVLPELGWDSSLPRSCPMGSCCLLCPHRHPCYIPGGSPFLFCNSCHHS